MAEQRGYSLKDALFNAEKVGYLGELFANSDPGFDKTRFEQDVMAKLPELELKERIVWICEILEQHLSDDFDVATEAILNALPPPLNPDLEDNDFGDFIFAPLGEFVSRNGVSEANLSRSLYMIKEITKRFSAEFAIRPFLAEFPVHTMAHLASWSGDDNYHVLRLVSEGTRPTLPWAMRTGMPVAAGLPLLERLYADKTRYVTRSVANHLNDVAKQKPDQVVELLERWASEGQQRPEEMDWMTRHALRVLVKQGHAGALALLGFRAAPEIVVAPVRILNPKTKVVIGDVLEFEVEIQARRDEKLMIDYAVEFVKADGKRKPKVFKLKQVGLKAGESVTVSKRHRLLGNATTFKLYPGMHRIVVQINGVQHPPVEFELKSVAA